MALTRTRRRILIATLVVVGILVASWWTLSRPVDQRFVGSWQSSDIPGFIVTYRVDGTYSATEQGVDIDPANEHIWWVENDRLITASNGSALDGFKQLLILQVAKMRGAPFPAHFVCWNIVRIDAESIDLRSPDGTVQSISRVSD